jgi:hypothetical protein
MPEPIPNFFHVRRFGTALGERCEPYGDWLGQDRWNGGYIAVVGPTFVKIATDDGMLSLHYRQLTWKAKKNHWAVWSSKIDSVVQQIEASEAYSDKIVTKTEAPILGSYVMLSYKGRTRTAFMVSRSGSFIHCQSRARRPFSQSSYVAVHTLPIADLTWNAAGHWQAPIDSPNNQEHQS